MGEAVCVKRVRSSTGRKELPTVRSFTAATVAAVSDELIVWYDRYDPANRNRS